MIINNQPVKSIIAKRFILYIVLFSSVLTLFITAIQLYRDYTSDIALIDTELKQIEAVHLESLTAALWASNLNYLQTSLDGISQIRDVQYVEIRDEDKIWAKAGMLDSKNSIQRIYSMDFRHRNQDLNIGTLTVNVSLDGVYQRLVEQVWVVLISNGVKTTLVALFIYFLFHHLVGRHLSTISAFTQQQAALTGEEQLVLDRKTASGKTDRKEDEFDIVAKSINDMRMRLFDQMAELDRQKHHLSQTLNSIGDAVVTTDSEGNVTRLNPIAEQLTGWTNAEALNKPLKTIFSIVNADTREIIPNPVDKVLATGETVYLSNHTTLIAKNGDEYQIADSAAPIVDDEKILGMVLVFNDVTEQYALRQSLQKREKQLRLIHSQIPGIVFQFKIDKNGKRFVPYASPAIETYCGLTPKEVMNDAEAWFGIVHHDDLPSLEKTIAESLTYLTVWIWEGRFVRKDGKTLWLQGTATPEKTKEGDVIWHGLFIDVTERRGQEEQLRQSQKMDALGKLTGGIAHDYNNILGIILGYSEQITTQADNAEKVTQYAQIITRSAERGSALAKKLLSFSHGKLPSTSIVNINAVLQEIKPLLENTLTAKNKLVFELDGALWQAEMDEGDLEDTILNMSINAFHAMNKKGTLTIATCNTTLNENDVLHLNINAGDYVILSLTDTGSGMDTAIKERIFDPFFSTKDDGGTGLGLSQVYGFVERSGGAITVYSEINHGSRFVLYFPKSDNAVVSKKVNTDVNEKVINVSGSETLLVVDDEQAMVDLAHAIFTAQGYNVLTANDGEQALTVLKQHEMHKKNKQNANTSNKIDLIISDVIMPNMDGYQLAAQVRQDYPGIKIQMVSGFADQRHEGMVDDDLHLNLLHKPYATNSLLTRVRQMLDENNKADVLSDKIILTLDDDDDIQSLYGIYLKKLGCHVKTVFSSKEAIEIYQNALNTEKPIDIFIVDLSIPGDLSGNEVKDKIRQIHPSAKLVVASGNSEGIEMTKPQECGFDGALEKNFNVENMRAVLETVLKG